MAALMSSCIIRFRSNNSLKHEIVSASAVVNGVAVPDDVEFHIAKRMRTRYQLMMNGHFTDWSAVMRGLSEP